MSPGDCGKISIFVLVDALGWEHLRNHEFLTDILPFRRCLFKKARFLSCFSWTVPLALFPERLRENHRTRRAIGGLTRVMYRISGYFCLYEVPVSILHRLDYVERKDLWQPGALAGCPTILDALSSRSIPYSTSGWRGTDEVRVELCLNALSRMPVQCCFLYLSELDAALHSFGLDSKQARDELVAASVRIRRLLARAHQLYSQVELFVFSDHGMNAVTEAHDLQSTLASQGPKRSHYLAFFDSTMARFWPKNREIGGQLEEVLSSLSYGRVLSESELSELGLGFSGNEHGEIIFIMNPGHIVAPSFVSNGVPKAMHGFHPSDSFSRACFLSCKELASTPRHVKDMYSFFETQLGLQRE